MQGLLILLFIALPIYLTWCAWKIATKAGYSSWFGLLMLVPVLNLVVLGIFAYETWPILQTKQTTKTREAKKIDRELDKFRRNQHW